MTTFGEYMSQVLKVAKPANLPYLVTPKPTRVVESRLTSSLQQHRRFNDVVATIFRRIKSFISIHSLILRKKFFFQNYGKKNSTQNLQLCKKWGLFLLRKNGGKNSLFFSANQSPILDGNGKVIDIKGPLEY